MKKNIALFNYFIHCVVSSYPISQDDFDRQQFKIMDYFKNMGFELVNVIHEDQFEREYYSIRFYFKRKGL